jgi:hypothetical protein
MKVFGLSVAALSLAFMLVGCGGAAVPEDLLVPPAPSLAVEAEGKVITLRAEFGEETDVEAVTAYGFYFGQDVSALEKIPVSELDGTGYSLTEEAEYSSTYVAKAWISNGRDEVVSEAVSVTTVDAPVDPGLDYDNSILFADPAVEALCVAKWDLDGNGKLTAEEAAKVTDIGWTFRRNTTITSFNELKYFTSLRSLPDSAFRGCSHLVSTEIPENVVNIGEHAFEYCFELMHASLPEGLKYIRHSAFAQCFPLKLDRLPEGLEVIADAAFGHCGQLTLTSLPETVVSIGNCAFRSCSQIYLTSLPPRLTSIEGCAFQNCPMVCVERLPSNLAIIKEYAFNGCGMTRIEIPSGVKTIKEHAFDGCRSLSTVTVLATQPPSAQDSFIGEYAYEILVPASSLEAYRTSPCWSSWKDKIKAAASE